jgi:hypothetical protein
MQVQNFDVFTLGIGRVIASGYAMKNCISFLLTAYLKPMNWIVKNGVHFKNIHAINYELRDKFLSRFVIDKNYCPNCADQESIAAPGQTVLCQTHNDEKHYAEMKEFFIENLKDLHFNVMLPFCSGCGKDSPEYVGTMMTSTNLPLTFGFCVDCRHGLVMKQNALIELS